MLDTTTNQNADWLARQSTTQLQAIARALRERASRDAFAESEIFHEIAKVERLIASRQPCSSSPHD